MSFYGQGDTLAIVRHTDNDLIIPKDVKVLFKGIINELFIDVPNCKSFEVSGDKIKKISKNVYRMVPDWGLKVGSDVILTINIILKNNKKITENHIFKIRSIGSVTSRLNKNQSAILSLQINNLKNAILDVKYEDKYIENTFQVTRFSVKIPGIPPIVVNGDKIDDKTFEQLKRKASKFDELCIFDIKVRVISPKINPMCIRPTPIVIKIL